MEGVYRAIPKGMGFALTTARTILPPIMQAVISIIVPFILLASMLSQIWSLNGHFDGFTVDRVGYIYTWQGQELVKRDANGKEMFRYSEMRYGDIGSVDANNSFKIMLFYQEHGLIRFLDNSLSDRSSEPFNLINEGFALPTLVCSSFDNGFWVWDQALLSLTRFDQNRNETVKIENVNQLCDRKLQPTRMFESGSRLYMVDDGAVLEFDLFGAYLKPIPVPSVNDVQVEEDVLFYRSNDTLYSFHLQKFEAGSFVLPDVRIKQLEVTNQRLFILTDNALSAFDTKAK